MGIGGLPVCPAEPLPSRYSGPAGSVPGLAVSGRTDACSPRDRHPRRLQRDTDAEARRKGRGSRGGCGLWAGQGRFTSRGFDCFLCGMPLRVLGHRNREVHVAGCWTRPCCACCRGLPGPAYRAGPSALLTCSRGSCSRAEGRPAADHPLPSSMTTAQRRGQGKD